MRLKLRAPLLALGLAALIASPAFAAPEPGVRTRPPIAKPMWIEKVKDGLYLIRGPITMGCSFRGCDQVRAANQGIPHGDDGLPHEPGTIAVRVTDDGVILVDCSYAELIDQTLALVRSVTSQPVKYVINTHYHQDHAGAVGELMKRGVLVIQQDNLRLNYNKTKIGGETPHVTFGEFASLYLGGAKVELYHFGAGHTGGDTFVYFPDLKVVHTGDVAGHSMPHIDYRGGGGSAVGWVHEMYQLLNLDFDVMIAGHGDMHDKAFVRDYVRKVEIMNDRMKDLVRRGVPKDQIATQLKLDDLGWDHSPATSTFMSNDISGYYDEMATVLAAEKEQKPSLAKYGSLAP